MKKKKKRERESVEKTVFGVKIGGLRSHAILKVLHGCNSI